MVHVYGSSGLWFIIYKQSVFVFNSSYFVFSGSLRSFQLPFWFFSVCHTCLPWNYLCKDMFQYASLRPLKKEAKKVKGEKRRVCVKPRNKFASQVSPIEGARDLEGKVKKKLTFCFRILSQ
jgi:hypothetical protein